MKTDDTLPRYENPSPEVFELHLPETKSIKVILFSQCVYLQYTSESSTEMMQIDFKDLRVLGIYCDRERHRPVFQTPHGRSLVFRCDFQGIHKPDVFQVRIPQQSIEVDSEFFTTESYTMTEPEKVVMRALESRKPRHTKSSANVKRLDWALNAELAYEDKVKAILNDTRERHSIFQKFITELNAAVQAATLRDIERTEPKLLCV